MLKNVVLPAPFGPMRLTMARSGMSKSTELTATSPPKTLVIPRASRILAPPVAAAASITVQLLGALAVGDNSLRPQEHHDDEDDAEEKEVVAREVHGAQGLAPDGFAYGVNPLVRLG